MSVLKMKLVNIAGPIKKFDEIVLKHIINNDVHLENTHLVLESVDELIPFMDENIYDSKLFTIEDLNKYFNVNVKKLSKKRIVELLEQKDRVNTIDKYTKRIKERIQTHNQNLNSYHNSKNEKLQVRNQMMPIIDLDVDIDNLFHLEFIKFRFGKLSVENYRKLKRYLGDLNVVLITNQIEEETVWISYFMPASIASKIDAIFESLFFERIKLVGGIKGTPKQVQEILGKEIEELNKKIDEENIAFSKYIESERTDFQRIYTELSYLQRVDEIKVYAAHTLESFYIVGWVSEQKALEIKKTLSSDLEMMFIEEDANEVQGTTPPTKLKNKKLIAPYEILIYLYGLPEYNTIDPTSFVAITYTLMFGIMFGDVGQGFIFLLAGIFLKFIKKQPVGLIGINIGIVSMIFGGLYGSVFGSEEIIKPIWTSPLHSINTILILSVGMGVFLIITALIINIINKIRTKDYGELFFSKNGLAGFVLYVGAIIFVVYFIITGQPIDSIILMVLFFGIPIVVIFFEKQLTQKLIKAKSKYKEKHSYVESFFELFEALLGFLSNTISFVRVGAFALNHAGLSLAIWSLYNMSSSAGGKILVVVLGNILIIGLEGLIVGIQSLRLQYYEMFSRFFKTNGRKFVSQDVGKNN